MGGITKFGGGGGAVPMLVVELGNSGQANGGLGIDNGDHYELDMRVGATAVNGFQYTTNSDGTINIPSGQYLVNVSGKIIAPAPDTYSLPAQVIFAIGQSYGWPGVYQYAVQKYPDAPQSSKSISGALGSIEMGGTSLSWGSGSPLWMGFSKVLGGSGQNPLALQGWASIMKIG